MEIGKNRTRYPGFKFSPTEEELILYYLRRKLDGFQKCVQVIAEIDINEHEPWDLPEKSVIWSDNEWFFFSTRGKKYSKGFQSKRTTESGYWKATGRERNVKSGTRVVGTKRTLVFHKGRPPKGERTEWIMHEYRMSGTPQESLVVCRVRKNIEYNDDIFIQQLDRVGDNIDLPQKDVFDGPIANNVENKDMLQGFIDNCYNPHLVDRNDSKSEYDRRLGNLIFYDESCSSPKFQGYDGITDDCFANILDDNSIKPHGSSLSSYADLLENDTGNDNFLDFKFKQPIDGVPLATLPLHETANREIKLKQRQPTEGISPATLPFQGTANRRIRLNWQHKRKPMTPVEESSVKDDMYCIVADSADLPHHLITPLLNVAVNNCRVVLFLILVLLVMCFWVLI